MITIGYGCLWPEGHFGRQIAQDFAARVGALSGGAIAVVVTPPTPDMDSTRAVLDGRLQMASGHAIQEFAPEIGLSYLPYLYHSFEHFQRVWTLGGSPVSDAVIRRFAERELPVEVLGYSLIGKRNMITRERAIAGMADFARLKVRVDGSPTATATFAALAAEPVAIEYHQTLAALRDGAVDAAENSPFNLIAMGWWEACTHVSLTEHLLLLNVEIVNAAFWRGLAPAHQTLLRSEMQGACRLFAATAQAQYASAIHRLAHEYRLRVNGLAAEARAGLAAALEPMRAAFVARHRLEEAYAWVVAAGRAPEVRV